MTRKRTPRKKAAPRTWPISQIGVAYLDTVKAQLDQQWNTALQLVVKESGVPDGVTIIRGEDDCWYEAPSK